MDREPVKPGDLAWVITCHPTHRKTIPSVVLVGDESNNCDDGLRFYICYPDTEKVITNEWGQKATALQSSLMKISPNANQFSKEREKEHETQ